MNTSTFPALCTTPHGRPVGAIGYGRFTPEEAALAAAGDAAFKAKVEAAQAAVPPPMSREEMYAALFGAA